MKKSMLLLSVLGLLSLLPAAEPSVNFSGYWEFNVQKSDAQARKGNASVPLVIVQTENEIQLCRTVNGRRADERYQLDGKKIVMQLSDGKKTSIEAKLKGNTFEITNENEYAGGKNKFTRKYSLSKDGKTLNVSMVSNASSAGQKLVYSKADAAPGAAYQPSNPGPSEKAVKPEAYAAAALESVKNQRSVDGLNLEIVGEPVLKPDGSGLHANAPDAIVRVNLNKGTTVGEQAMVVFANNRPTRTLFSPQESPFSKGTLDRPELQQVANELDSFFTAAIDVSLGSERFYPYLPKDIRSLLKHPDRKFRMYMPPGAVDPSWREQLAREGVRRSALDGLAGWKEKLSDNELRRFVALQLDVVVQQSLLGVKGYVKEAMDQASRQRPEALVSNPREFIKLLEENISQSRSLLEKTEVLSSEYLIKASGYMKLMIGQGFVVKEISKPDPCPCFISSPADATLYVTSWGSPSGGLALHFARTGGTLRIVCAALP